MSSLISLHLDNVEYNADRIARLFPKCKQRSNTKKVTTAAVDINRNPVAVSDTLDNDRAQLMDKVNTASHERLSADTCDKSNDQNNVGCNGNSSNALGLDNDDSSCSRASSPFDMSDEDDDSDDTSSPRAIPPSSSDAVSVTPQHHQRFHQPHQHNYHHYGRGHHHHHAISKRKLHKVQPAAHQYKLRDSRMSDDKKYENAREITETVFASEIKSVKHPQTISLGINGSVIFDDIDENWKNDISTSHIPQRTYHSSNCSHNSNSNKENNVSASSKTDSVDGPEKNGIESNSKMSPTPHIIGGLPIAEYEGSPRRYGLRPNENIMPTLLSSPTISFPRPGFPQRILEDSPVSSASTPVTSLPPTTTNSSFNYLYEYSETRKVLEEFFKPDEVQDKTQQFRELEYELKRRRRPSYDQGNSYVGLRLAEARDTNLHSSPRKQSQDSSEYSNQEQGFLSNYTVSTENLGLPIEFQISSNDKSNMMHHNRYSISPDLERRFGQSRNFTLSPETTDCESNFGEGDSDVSSLMLIMDPDVGNSGTNTGDRLYPSMPVLEDGLSSGHTSDNENNNPTVLLMKKQITEIEREIVEKSNRCTSTAASSTATTTTISSTSQSNYKPSSNTTSSSSNNQHNDTAEKQTVNSRNADIDLESLDPLGVMIDKQSSSPPPPAPTSHRDNRSFTQTSNHQNAGNVEATIKDIRMTLQRTKTLPLRPLCVTNGDSEDRESNASNKSETPIWVPRRKGAGSGPSGDEEDPDTDLETDRLLGQQRTDDQGFFDEKVEKENGKKKTRNKEDLHDPAVLIEGILFRAKYLGTTQLICEGQPTKATRMMQAEEAVSRIKAPEGESQPMTEVDLFISTEKIMVLNTDLKEIMMDHSLRTISYIADIGDLVVLMARRRLMPQNVEDLPKNNRNQKMICHVFESDEAQFIAQSIGQAFQVAYMEFLKANGIEDHSFIKEMDYQEVLNSQEIFGDELQMFAKKELQKDVVVPKMKGEILGVVIVESGWGSMLPTVVIANLAPAGAAFRCGQLNIGDQIIAVNGVSLVGLPLSTCQTYIKNSKPHSVVKLTVVPCAPVVEVKIKRPDTKYQLGFSVQNGVICSLLRGGIAERGGVRVGHRIIEINNQSVVAVPHEKIVTLLATSVGEILMKTMPTSMFRLLTGQETPVFI